MKSFKGWEIFVSSAAAIAAGISMRNDFFQEAVAEIVTVLGFIMAALVPAMALAATSVRAGNFSVLHIRRLGQAMQQQVMVFGGLFLYSLLACLILLCGKLLHWEIHVKQPLGYDIEAGLGFLFPALAVFFILFLSLRSIAFVNGMLSLLRLSLRLAEDEARARDAKDDQGGQDELASYELPAQYGSPIEHDLPAAR